MDAQRYLFISYKHDELSTRYAREIYQHFAAYADGLDFELYMDDADNLAGCEWAGNVDAQSEARATGMLAFGHRDQVNCACFSPDGERVLTASVDQSAQLWNARTGQPIGPPIHGMFQSRRPPYRHRQQRRHCPNLGW